MIDGFVALISVPTQVYFVATYGKIILEKIAKYKMYALEVFVVLLIIWLIRKVYLKNTQKNN